MAGPVFGLDNRALYFSKEVIPYTGRDFAADAETPRGFRLIALRHGESGPDLTRLDGLERLIASCRRAHRASVRPCAGDHG